MIDEDKKGAAGREALTLFADGHNCAQAVFAALAPRFGLDRDAAVRLATGFGVGQSMGETCGAVSGAVMALGLAYGGGGPDKSPEKKATYALAGRFFEAFRAAHGSVCCRELIGCDPSTPEGYAMAARDNLFVSVCVPLVVDAATIVEAMLADTTR